MANYPQMSLNQLLAAFHCITLRVMTVISWVFSLMCEQPKSPLFPVAYVENIITYKALNKRVVNIFFLFLRQKHMFMLCGASNKYR